MLSQSLNVDVLISGAGIAGLSYAWEALLAKKSVMIVCNRSPEYVRMQRIFLQKWQRNYLHSMLDQHSNYVPIPEDKKFLHEVDHSPAVALKDIEKFFLRNLYELHRNNFDIHFQFNSMIASLDFRTGIAKVSPLDKMQQYLQVTFTDVVGADGLSYHANSLVNQNLKDEPILYVKDNTPECKDHFSVYFTLERSDGKELPPPLTYIINIDENNCYYAIAIDSESYIKSAKKQIKCFLVGELPTTLCLTNDAQRNKELILSHLKNLIVRLLHDARVSVPDLKILIVKNSNKHGTHKDQLKLLSFTMKNSVAKMPVYSIGSRSFYLAGECLQNSNYQTGLRLNNIFLEAYAFGEFLRGKKSKTEYIRVCQDNIIHASNSTLKFFINKKEAVAQASKEIGELMQEMKRHTK